MQLRDYQQRAKSGTFRAWRTGSRTVLGTLPTGAGKTIVFSHIIKELLPLRTMVLAHRQELIFQAKSKIESVIPGLHVDVEMGEYKASMHKDLFHPHSDVIVSTIQTHTAGGDGAGRIGKFDPMDFGCLIIDEAHHALSDSYRRVIDYYMTNPKLVVLGVTATPDRADKKAMGAVFESVGFNYSLVDAIRDGWLVPIDQKFVTVESLDFSKIRTTAGDLNNSDLEAVMVAEKPLMRVASSTIQIVGNRQGIGFASSVNHARMLSEIFNRPSMGFPGRSASIHAGTDKEERIKIGNDFRSGALQWIWNYGIFTEGADFPMCQVISMARPTKSRALYAQMAGRATRPDESVSHALNDIGEPILRRAVINRSLKPSCLLIDFVGNSGKHRLMSSADILSGDMPDDVVDHVVQESIRTGKTVRMFEKLEDEDGRKKQIEARRIESEARRARLAAKATFVTQDVNPFDEFNLRPIASNGIKAVNCLTEKQRKFLRTAGLNPDKLEFKRAKQLIGMISERRKNKKCSLGQAKILKRFGCNDDVSYEQASSMLDQIKANGWKKPAHFENEVEQPKENENPY